MVNLGVMYATGEGVKQDDAEAVKWYRQAAVAGNALAMLCVGFVHETGDGVKRDEAEALKWYRQAKAAGHPGANARIRWLEQRQRTQQPRSSKP